MDKATAEREMELFRYAVHYDGASSWTHWQRSDTDGAHATRTDGYADLLPGVPRRGLKVLCRCNLPLKTYGQDESCYAAYSLPMKEWVFDNQAMMRKITEAQDVMVTLMIGPDGLGIPLSPEQLVQVNEYRQARERAPLTCSSSMLFFEYGVRREGYWNSEKFCGQMVDAMDCLDVKYPGCQFCFEVDQS